MPANYARFCRTVIRRIISKISPHILFSVATCIFLPLAICIYKGKHSTPVLRTGILLYYINIRPTIYIGAPRRFKFHKDRYIHKITASIPFFFPVLLVNTGPFFCALKRVKPRIHKHIHGDADKQPRRIRHWWNPYRWSSEYRTADSLCCAFNLFWREAIFYPIDTT